MLVFTIEILWIIFPPKSFVPIDTMLKKIIPMKQTLIGENLNNSKFALYIVLIPVNCHMRFRYIIAYDIRVKLTKGLKLLYKYD